ncbi:MAG: hypothetical protein H5U28_14910 [Burkholderiaceae bacterium]|nr:hypothetical protein [Burkholderiaceae bacterium]
MQETRPDKSTTACASDHSIEPLVAAEVNLESFPWAPVRLAFLSGHPLALLQDPEPFRALVLLIANAWHKLPAMTAPNDDVQLAAMAGFGRDVNAWMTVRESVMQGWILCSDGRWHHPELAAWALYSWDKKKNDESFRAKQSARARSRSPKSHNSHEGAQLNSHGAATAQPYKKEQNQNMTADDTRHEGEDSWPEAGPSYPLTRESASMQDMESVAKEDGNQVDEDQDVIRIFDHWKYRTERPNEKLTHSRKAIIRARLREGFSPAQICQAIDNAAQSDFHQGRTPKHNQRMDTLDVICKDADRILRLASGSGIQTRSSRVKPAVRSTAESFSALLDVRHPEFIDVQSPEAPILEGGVQ